MADSERDSPPSVPPKEPIGADKPKPTTEASENGEPRAKSSSEVGSMRKENKGEEKDRPRSQEKRSHKVSSGHMPGSWDDDGLVKPSSKPQGSRDREAESRKNVAKDDLMELDHSGATIGVLSKSGAHHSQPLRGTALAPTTEEFYSLDDLTGFEIDSFTQRASDIQEENSRLNRHVKDLHKKLSTLSTDKQIAEEKADRLSEKIESMKLRISSNMTEVERSSEALASKVEELAKENQALREQLNDAQSHIFSLQPYRKDLTPEEVGQEYDALVEQVQDWVQKFMEPWLEDYNGGVDALLNNAKKRGVDAVRFRNVLYQYPDLTHGSNFPETDEDIITSVIMRFLHDNIFQSILYGAIPKYVEHICFIENHMQASVEPKRDLFAVRTWTAEAYNALLSCPQFKSVHQQKREEMTQELANILKIFFKKEQFQWFCENLSSRVVHPAMKLYEKLQVSTNHFYLDINPFIVRVEGELNTSTDFIDSLRNLDCKNVLQNRKGFNVDKLDPAPSKKELYHRLHNICTVVPALYMRQIGQRDAIKDPIVVRKQQMLVAWGSEEKCRAYRENGDRTLVSHLYSFKTSGEGWASFLK
ncbi:hypothetical protein F53441_4687 [Fusarium austroafricanum]|uniref:Uncharacterized protein n=1 Tax=Fusarium austroafricanum TaxID=2364996 RepID=A0A8H4KJS9_9HYPO|nr:hypothetical protein F53441_4687 [Fusarium austroafricanum]